MAKKTKKQQEDELNGQEYVLEKALPEKKRKKEPYIKLTLDAKMKTKLTKIIMDQVKDAESNEDRKKFIDHAKYARKRYLMEDYIADEPWEGASQRRTGGSTIAMDRLIPREKRAIYYSGNIIDVEPDRDNSDSNAQMQEVWLDAVLRYEIKDEENCDKLLYDANFLNFGCEKNHWVDETEIKETVAEYESAQELLRNYPDAIVKYPKYILTLTGIPDISTLLKTFPEIKIQDYSKLPNAGVKLRLLERYRAGYVGHKAEWLDPEDVIFPKGTTDYKKTWLCIHHQKMRRDELIRKDKSNFFENVDKIFNKENEKDENKDYGKEYDIYEAILKYDINDDDLEEKCVFWVAKSDSGNNVYLRGIRFPFDHGNNYIIVYRTDSTRYGFYTGGIAAKLKSVNKCEDRRVNQISNAWDQAICKPWFHVQSPGSPYRPRVHKRYPGAIIPVSNERELIESVMSDIPNSSLSLVDDTRRESEMLLGFNLGATSGQTLQQDPTGPAKKSEIELAEGEVSIDDRIRKYSIGYKEKAHQIQMNYYQFTDTTELNYRTDKGFKTITKQEMRAKAMFTMRSAIESINAQDKAKADLALLQVSKEDPLMANNYQFRMYLWESVVQNWSEQHARNKDKVMSPEVQQLIIQQLYDAEKAAEQRDQEDRLMKEMERQKKKLRLQGVPSEKIDIIIKEQMAQFENAGQETQV